MSTLTTISAVRKGDFIRFRDTDTAPVWIRGDYDRSSRTYSVISFNDACHERFLKGTAKCFIDFDF